MTTTSNNNNNNNHIVLAFGRAAGITKGHQKVFEKVVDTANKLGGTAHIHLSKSFEHKKNPIAYEDKIDLAKKMMPHIGHAFEDQKHVRTFIDALKHHSNPNSEIHIVAGKDRHEEFKKLAGAYNGKDYHYKKIHIVSSGDRDDGISGTHLRNLANDDNYDEFSKHAPTTAKPEHVKRMFDLIKSGSVAPPKKPRTKKGNGKLVEAFLYEANEAIKKKKRNNKIVINPDISSYQIKTHKESEVSQNASQQQSNTGF